MKVIIFLLCLLTYLQAENFYVRPNGNLYGLGDGSDWNNAFSGLPAFNRPSGNGDQWTEEENPADGLIGPGDTVFVAGGVYTTDWEPGASGKPAKPIVIIRATAEKHGTDIGWDPAFDSQVILDGVSIVIWGVNENDGFDYLTIDGQVWEGIKVDKSDGESGHLIDLSPSNRYPSNYITIKYVEAEGPGRNSGIDNTACFRSTPVAASPPEHTGITVQYCHFHDVATALMKLQCCNSFLLEYSEIHGTEDETLHEDYLITYYSNNGMGRYNIFYDTESEGVYFENDCSNWYIYDNLFYQNDYPQGGHAISASGKTDVYVTNFHVYNNTIVNYRIGIRFSNPNDQATIYNNICYDNYAHTAFGQSVVHDYNWYSGPDNNNELHGIAGNREIPFVDYSNRDFHLYPGASPINAGKSDLDSIYQYDLAGQMRDSLWDIGAYEYIPNVITNYPLFPVTTKENFSINATELPKTNLTFLLYHLSGHSVRLNSLLPAGIYFIQIPAIREIKKILLLN